jgi:hypothetical protein
MKKSFFYIMHPGSKCLPNTETLPKPKQISYIRFRVRGGAKPRKSEVFVQFENEVVDYELPGDTHIWNTSTLAMEVRSESWAARKMHCYELLPRVPLVLTCDVLYLTSTSHGRAPCSVGYSISEVLIRCEYRYSFDQWDYADIEKMQIQLLGHAPRGLQTLLMMWFWSSVAMALSGLVYAIWLRNWMIRP